MRSFVSFVCGLAAAIALVAAVPALWVAQHVTSEDGYVSLLRPVVHDADLHGLIGSEIASAIVPSSLSGPARTAADSVVTRVVRTVAADPDFATAWDQTNRRSHQIMFDDQRDLPANLDASNRLVVDLGPLAAYVAKKVQVVPLPVSVKAPDQIVVPLNGRDQQQGIDEVKRAPRIAALAFGIAALLALMSVVAARRRATAVVWLGAGVIVVAAGLKLGWAQLSQHAVDRNSAPSPLAREVVQVLLDRATSSFDHSLLVVAGVGLVALVAGLVARAVTAVRA